MKIIEVAGLKKYFYVTKRQPGFLAHLKSVFAREYKEVKAVNDVSFEIAQGELVGFIGPNGAGKTTTLKCLSGLLYPSSGNISVLGFKPFDRKNDFLKKISLVMGQKNQLWWDLPAIDTFSLNKEIYELTDGEYNRTLNQLTSMLEVTSLLNVPVRHLSLGQRMKMELIAALIHSPKVLFLDEPTIGLDVVMQKKVREFISSYNLEFKSTILLTSHYMTDVKKLCQRVIIIDKGSIIYDGDLDKLVEKYAATKFITVEFDEKEISPQLQKLKYVTSIDFPKIKLHVPREKANDLVSHILKNYKIADLIIEEPDIEEIIRLVFTKNSK